jgi:hypothetical protein
MKIYIYPMETKHKIGDGEPRKVPGYTYCVLVWTDDIGGEGILYPRGPQAQQRVYR